MGSTPRPAHLTPDNAAAFQLRSVVENYHLRTPYPSGLVACLRRLMRPEGGKTLELGCGTGEIARTLAPYSERVDAIDISAAMLEKAKSLTGGEHPRIRWIHGSAEQVALDSAYAIAIAGDSLHWMIWETVLPRIREALAADALLAIVTAVAVTPPWSSGLQDVIRCYSVMQNFAQFSLVDELVRRHLFEPLGEETVGPEPFRRSVEEYIDAIHATAGFPRERMGADDARLLDDAVRMLVAPYATSGALELGGSAQVVWGRPLGKRLSAA